MMHLPIAGIVGGDAASNPAFFSHTFTGGSMANLVERLGYRFTVGGVAIVCNRLGYFHNENGNTENIRVHRVSDGVLIREANIVSVAFTWVDQAVAEFTLSAGVAYTISHRAGGAGRNLWRNPATVSFYAGITKTANVYGYSNALPTTTSGNVYIGARFGYA